MANEHKEPFMSPFHAAATVVNNVSKLVLRKTSLCSLGHVLIVFYNPKNFII